MSISATTCPAFTMSPSSTNNSAMRPANLVSLTGSISQATVSDFPNIAVTPSLPALGWRIEPAANPHRRKENRFRLQCVNCSSNWRDTSAAIGRRWPRRAPADVTRERNWISGGAPIAICDQGSR